MAVNVLIVDSDVEMCGSIGEMLQSRHSEVQPLVAHDGEEAIDVLVEHGDYVDAVMLSPDLPVTDGWELLYVLKDKDNWPEIPIVMMVTEHAMWEDSLKAHTLGANHFVSKPVSADELTPVLDKLLTGELT